MELPNAQPMGDLPPELNQESQMGDQQIEEPTHIFAHVSPEEIPYLNEMQGREIIDPETGLRDYTLLSTILQFPETQQALGEASEIENTKKMAEGGHVEQEGRPIAPELEELRKAGRGGDTELIIITPELAEIFDKWNEGQTTTNPVTGFPEYGFFTEFLRVAGPIVGAVLGGPIGAFAGSVAANKLTGKSWGDSLKQGLISGTLAYAAPMAGGAFSSAFPGASSALGGASKSILGQTMGGAVNNLFTPAAQGAGILSSFGANTAKAGIPQAASQAAPNTGGGFGGILGSLGGKIVPLAAAGLMLAKGHQQEQKSQQDYEAKQKAELEKLRAQSGSNTPWKQPKPYDMQELPGQISPEDLASGKQRQYFNHPPLDKIDYKAEGGPIRGFGKGQQDNIPKNIKQNSYIIDASTVSDIGDGSSQAGFKELENFFSRIPSNPVHEKRGGFIKALVSNEEFEVLPDQVTALGGGSNPKGAQILENMVKQIREKKRTSGNKLPPKAQPIGGYLRNLSVA